MEEAPTPPEPALDEVVEWLATMHDDAGPERRFYIRLAIDLLTKGGGILPGFDITSYHNYRHVEGPYSVMFRWLPLGDSYQQEGVVVQRQDGNQFLASDLRSLPWRMMLKDEVRQRVAEAELVISMDNVVHEYGTSEALERWRNSGREDLAELSAGHLKALTTSSRKRYDDAHYDEVARMYDEALRQGSRSPVQDLADRKKVRASTAKNWVTECRKRGLLPPTEERKPKGNN
jgi:hypothetical protein